MKKEKWEVFPVKIEHCRKKWEVFPVKLEHFQKKSSNCLDGAL